MNKGIKIQIKPNDSQCQKIAQHFGANRWLWNYFLDKRKDEYKETKKSSTFKRDSVHLTKLRAEINWLTEVSCGSQQRTLRQLDNTYNRFFKKIGRLPKFKSKKRQQSFALAGGIKIKGNRIYLAKFRDGLKFNRSLPPYNKVNSVTIKQTASGKYYAILSVEADTQPKLQTGQDTGLDLGIKDFIVMSGGTRLDSLPATNKLKRMQQHLSRKKKGSGRFNKQCQKLALAHEKIANSREAFLHKISSDITRDFDFIAVEDLTVKNLMKNHVLAKAIAHASWGEFVRQLEYKSLWYGKKFIKVGRFYPSSKTCSDCGWVNQDLTLKDRQWVCGGCSVEHDRDINAARNILREGKLISGRLSPNNGRGESRRPKLIRKPRQLSAKRLAKVGQ